MKIRVITLCSGYDSQCMALERLKEHCPNFDYELVAWSEIDKYAIEAHDACFPEWKGRNVGDMTQVEWDRIGGPIDLLVYSTPCQSISNAGRQEGLKKGSGTRSSIIWSTEDAIRILRPRWLLMENVRNLVSEKFIRDFRDWEQTVASYGYSNYWKVLNAKDYGVPQNRERVFLVSSLGESYEFPKGFPLERRLKDVLEENVDERYCLSKKTIDGFMRHNKRHKKKGTGFIWEPKTKEDISSTITARYHKLGATDTTICITNYPFIKQYPRGFNHGFEYKDGYAPTITTSSFEQNNFVVEPYFRIRKLSPRECFRLMDMDDKYIDRIQEAGISNSQQYKLAGNSIVVNVLYNIFRKMFVERENEEPTLF